jgi:predicted transposase/invertase (TIGR01784 family)
MPRPTFADPKVDFAFKRIFGSEDHKDILIAFLNDMLDLDERHRIVRVDLLPPELRPAVAALKASIVDVRCRDARGVTYVVEMQVLKVEGFTKRVVYNVAKAYVNQLAPKDPYPELNDVVGITICDFEMWPDEGERKIPMLSRWQMAEQHTGAPGLGQIRLVFLELPKYDASRPPRTAVEKWAYFLREADSLAMVPEVLSEHPFVDALEAARVASFTVEEWDAHILQCLAIMDARGMIDAAQRRGRQLGELLGQEHGERQGLRHGLRRGVEALCHVLGIELTDHRRGELASLPVEGLTALLDRLRERKSWA